MLFHEAEIIYLPKDDVTTIQVNQTVDQKGDMVVPSDILKHFIEEANYHWIMDWCICRSSSKCEHYPIELGCLFLGEAAMRIDPKLGRKVTKEEALEHVEKCREAGLVQFIGRDKLDTHTIILLKIVRKTIKGGKSLACGQRGKNQSGRGEERARTRIRQAALK